MPYRSRKSSVVDNQNLDPDVMKAGKYTAAAQKPMAPRHLAPEAPSFPSPTTPELVVLLVVVRKSLDNEVEERVTSASPHVLNPGRNFARRHKVGLDAEQRHETLCHAEADLDVLGSSSQSPMQGVDDNIKGPIRHGDFRREGEAMVGMIGWETNEDVNTGLSECSHFAKAVRYLHYVRFDHIAVVRAHERNADLYPTHVRRGVTTTIHSVDRQQLMEPSVRGDETGAAIPVLDSLRVELSAEQLPRCEAPGQDGSASLNLDQVAEGGNHESSRSLGAESKASRVCGEANSASSICQ
jgi:hypothetical protein